MSSPYAHMLPVADVGSWSHAACRTGIVRHLQRASHTSLQACKHTRAEWSWRKRGTKQTGPKLTNDGATDERQTGREAAANTETSGTGETERRGGQ